MTYQMMYEILCAAEEYGAELNMELKRRLKRQCLFAPRFLRESLEEFENAKQILMWNHRLVQARGGYARQLTSSLNDTVYNQGTGMQGSSRMTIWRSV